jgi:hypothetical protein
MPDYININYVADMVTKKLTYQQYLIPLLIFHLRQSYMLLYGINMPVKVLLPITFLVASFILLTERKIWFLIVTKGQIHLQL